MHATLKREKLILLNKCYVLASPLPKCFFRASSCHKQTVLMTGAPFRHYLFQQVSLTSRKTTVPSTLPFLSSSSAHCEPGSARFASNTDMIMRIDNIELENEANTKNIRTAIEHACKRELLIIMQNHVVHA